MRNSKPSEKQAVTTQFSSQLLLLPVERTQAANSWTNWDSLVSKLAGVEPENL